MAGLVERVDGWAGHGIEVANARSHVQIAGWHITPDFGLTRDDWASRLRDLLGELAERVEVRVLLWAGAPLPVFTPARAAVRRVREELIRGSACSVRLIPTSGRCIATTRSW